jgi:hypothetical protein
VRWFIALSSARVDGEGFEPSKSETTDLQSVPFGHSGTRPSKPHASPPPRSFLSTIWPMNLLPMNLLVNESSLLVSFGPELAMGLEPATC